MEMYLYPTDGQSSLILLTDIHPYPIDVSFLFLIPMDMYLYPTDGSSSFILLMDKHLYPTNELTNTYQWILQLILLIYPSNGKIFIEKNILPMDSHASYQQTCFYFAKIFYLWIHIFVSNVLTIIL